jgi:hypothetical protein
LGHPQLNQVELAPVATRVLLGVGHPVTRRHQVQLAGPDDLLGSEAVPVDDLAGEEPGNGLQSHMRVGRDVVCRGFRDRGRSAVVHEAPSSNRPPPPLRQGPADPESADLRFPAGGDNRGSGFGTAGGAARVDILGGYRTAHGLRQLLGPAQSE